MNVDADIFHKLQHPEVRQFMQDHAHDKSAALVLKYKTIGDVPIAIIADQISGRRKAATKLPLYAETSGIVFPPSRNLEQCSSQAAAEYKALRIREWLGEPILRGADLTGGLGVDSFFLSRIVEELHYVEPHEPLLNLARHNHQQLGATNIQHQHTDAAQFLAASARDQFSFLYIDPSRRVKDSKVFRLEDCEPAVIPLLPALLNVSERLIVKASPLLDIQQGLRGLPHTEHVIVVAVDGECKEVLLFCRRGYSEEARIEAIDLTRTGESRFAFYASEEKDSAPTIGFHGSFLYEPNAAVMKAGAFKLIGARYGLDKVDKNTHLYTGHLLVPNFPGRVFKIERTLKADTRELHDVFHQGRANVISRNYPLSPDEIKKKYKLQDGGENYLIAFTSHTGKVMIQATRMS